MNFLYEKDVKDEDWFYPNDLKKEDLGNLEDWQLLIAAGHFAPKMGDCVDLNYGYVFRHKQIYVNQWGSYGYISLKGEVDLHKPMESLNTYSWQALVKCYLENEIL